MNVVGSGMPVVVATRPVYFGTDQDELAALVEQDPGPEPCC